jgi:hypothetical protein
MAIPMNSSVEPAAVRRGAPQDIFDLLFCIALIVAFWLVPDGISAPVIWACLSIVYVKAVQLLRKPVTIVSGVPTFVTVEALFFLFYYLIYFWPYQQHLIFGGTNLSRSAFILGNTFVDRSNQAVVIATLGLVAFLAGCGRVRHTPEQALERGVNESLIERKLIMLALLGQAASMGVYFGFGLRAAGEGRYTNSSSGGAMADGVSLLILMFCMLAIALVVSRLYRRERLGLTLWIGCAIAFSWAVRLLLLGDRNTFFLLAIVAIGGAFTYLVRVGRIVLAIAGFVAMQLYSAVEAARFTGPSVGALLAAMFDPQQKHRAGLNGSSFDITTISVRASLAAVPSIYDYGYGWFKLIGLAGVVPFIRGVLLSDYSGPRSTANLLSDVTLGSGASWGVGSNVISDIYVDFGLWGVPVVMFIVGIFCRKVQRRLSACPSSPVSTVYYLATLALVAEMPRYAVDSPVRVLCWLAVVVVLAKSLCAESRSGPAVHGQRLLPERASAVLSPTVRKGTPSAPP